eukprot:c21562_g1_i2 orf=1573-2715(-)
MREQGTGTLFLPERKKVSLKVSGKDEGADGRRRLSGGGYGASYGGGKASIANNHVSSMPLTTARLKGGSAMPSRHHNPLSDNSVIKEVVVAEGEPLNKKRTAEEGGGLPQWGHGKRSRCSRLEPSKHAVPVVEQASKLAPRSEKVTALKPRGPSKLTPNKSTSNGLLPRNGPINRTANGYVDTSSSLPSFSLRQNGGEAKERALLKEKASTIQQKNASEDHGSCRQQQGSDGSELATTTQGHAHCNGHISKIMNNNNGTCSGHISKIPNNNEACISSLDPTSLACSVKPRVDIQTLEWPRIVIALTRKQKEDDFLVLKGTKLPQRPKKRPKAVEKALLYCTPGNWLSDVTRGRYDVREKKSMKKKPRGLKAMESMESDSE